MITVTTDATFADVVKIFAEEKVSTSYNNCIRLFQFLIILC